MKLFIKPHTTVLFESIANLSSLLSKSDQRYALITDEYVERQFGQSLEIQLKKEGFDITLISFPTGEEHKTRATKESIEDALLKHRFGRDTCILALGGGVVTDLAGFTAATYCRGIPLISIPTNVMGMVDASIGGKTAVNTPRGKNLIGAFHPASLVLIDFDFLKTLPEEQWKNGFAEIIKCGLIASKSLFQMMEKEGSPNLSEIVYRSISIKKKAIEADFHEKGKRKILNFGHTVGHALENLLNYQVPHGEAIATGMLVESFLSLRLGGLNQVEFDRIAHLLKKYRFDLVIPKKISFEDLLLSMSMDKKSVRNSARFVILNSIGSVFPFKESYCTAIDPTLIQEAYDRFSY